MLFGKPPYDLHGEATCTLLHGGSLCVDNAGGNACFSLLLAVVGDII